MKIEITGAFGTFAKAQEAVRELEFAGITGEEVEVITGAEHDARDPQANPSGSKSAESKRKASPEFSHDAGGLTKQPYPGRTIIIVRSSDARSVDRITDILHHYGAENISYSGEPAAKMQQDKTETTSPRAIAATAPGLGAPNVTTGAVDTDLEARGKEFRTPRK
ncbi:MAG: hypothetical protein WCD49_11590 [Candidatus Acidiferrales bacterium]